MATGAGHPWPGMAGGRGGTGTYVSDGTARQYRLISADGHVNEPPTICSERMPARYRDRAPRVEHLEHGDAWIFEGWDGPINFGFNASAGMPPERRSPWIRWEDVPPRSYEAKARAAA